MGKRRQERRAADRAKREQKMKNFIGQNLPDVSPTPHRAQHSYEVPEGEWVDVRPNQVVAQGTYLDDRGVLRSTGDDSCVVWHNSGGGCGPSGQTGDYKKRIQPSEIIYDDNGAPWCPMCVAINQRKKIAERQLVDEKSQKSFHRMFPKAAIGETKRAELMRRFPSVSNRSGGMGRKGRG